MTAADVRRFVGCIAAGGVAVFPADTVYGLACHPESREAVQRLYRLKGRAEAKPAAVMFFDRDLALGALEGLGPRTTAALERLLPGAVTILLPNPAGRFPRAGAGDPGALGVRVPRLVRRGMLDERARGEVASVTGRCVPKRKRARAPGVATEDCPAKGETWQLRHRLR